jgi:phosphotriesterase-related protein
MFFVTRDADAMADLFVHDIEEGIQDTGIKAAFLKCAADEPGVTENVEKVHRAVARTSARTGAPIMAHSRPASQTAFRQIELFEEEGVNLERVQIAHTGDTDDLDYIERVLDKGVYIGMDRYGLEIFLPIEKRNATVAALLARGYADRMHLSQDYCATIDWYSVEVEQQLLEAGAAKGWSMTLVFDEVIPALREAGMSDEQLQTMMVESPKRWLAG